jgi:SAM-dependent methyltransferase
MRTARAQNERVSDLYDSIWGRGSHPELSAETAKLKTIFLDRNIPIRGKTVLDCGSGSGMSAVAFAALGASEVVGVDYSMEAVHLARSTAGRFGFRNINFQRHNLLEPLEMERQFDIVYAFAVLHHTGDTRKAFGNVALRCAPGGVLSVSLYLKTWLTAPWKAACLSYQRSPLWLRRIFNRAAAEFIRLHDRLLLSKKSVIIDHPIEQQVEEWFGMPIRSHYRYEEVDRWFREEGFSPELVLPRIARFKSTSNFVMNGIKS